MFAVHGQFVSNHKNILSVNDII